MDTTEIAKKIINKLEKVKNPEGLFQINTGKFTLKYFVYIGDLWIIRNQFSNSLCGGVINAFTRQNIATLKNGKVIKSIPKHELKEILEQLEEYTTKEI
jgi:hypothetical protein